MLPFGNGRHAFRDRYCRSYRAARTRSTSWRSNMPACGPCANPGGAPISCPGARSRRTAPRSANSGFNVPMRTRRPRPCCSSCCSRDEPLSIQVHPDDAFAHSIGLANGKTEAWYILSATPEAQVAVGLKRQHHGCAIAGRDRGWLDRGPGSMAPGPQGRRHLRPGRHHPRHRRGTRARRNPAEQRHDVPPVRPWPAARNPRRQRRRGRQAGAGRMSIGPAASDRCPIPARREPVFRSRADRPAAEFELGSSTPSARPGSWLSRGTPRSGW